MVSKFKKKSNLFLMGHRHREDRDSVAVCQHLGGMFFNV